MSDEELIRRVLERKDKEARDRQAAGAAASQEEEEKWQRLLAFVQSQVPVLKERAEDLILVKREFQTQEVGLFRKRRRTEVTWAGWVIESYADYIGAGSDRRDGLSVLWLRLDGSFRRTEELSEDFTIGPRVNRGWDIPVGQLKYRESLENGLKRLLEHANIPLPPDEE